MKGVFGFLTLGPGRGGTSLLAALLDCHPDLAVAFEHFSEVSLMGRSIEGSDASNFHVRTARFMQACMEKAEQYPRCAWGNKITTEQLAALEDHNADGRYQPVDVLEVFFNHVLAGQRLVFILRDGRTCVRSKMARTTQSLETACERWLYSVKVYEYLSEHPRAICIRYESLILRPETTLDAVCSFLGTEYDSAMLAGTQHSRMNPDYRYPTFETSKLELRDIPEGCEDRLAEALVRCGYPVSYDGGRRLDRHRVSSSP